MHDIKIIADTKWERWRADTFYTKEPETIAWIKGFEPNSVFWDIGANIGVFSLFCAAVHPDLIVHAFEPMRNNYIKLWQNIWQNEFENITAHYINIGARNGTCVFDPVNHVKGSSGGRVVAGIAPKEQQYVMPIKTIDSLSLDMHPPNYIKIDTDGAEFDILSGMDNIFKSGVIKSVLVEINGLEDNIFTIMRDAGFVPWKKYNQLKNRKSDKNVIFRRAKHELAR